MKSRLKIFWVLALCGTAHSQTYWNPDSTGYNYLSRGANLSQWVGSPGTTVAVDTSTFLAAASSIKWMIPPNSGVATLELRLIDLDLREQVIYLTARRNNYATAISAYLMVAPGKGFTMAKPEPYDPTWYLPPGEWHRFGRSTLSGAFGGATWSDLEHAKNITFVIPNAEVEQIFWIDEIKYTRPRGPACIIHFNAYRRTADSLLVPWLIERGYPANIDFIYEWAKTEKWENRNYGGILVRYMGLGRIAELVRLYNWSTTHHGTFYKNLPVLSREERLQLYSLEPYLQAGFTVNWCFAVPRDVITPEILAEIKALERFYTLRKQYDWDPNELPLDNPLRLRFYRPTSAAASPNLIGRPRSLAEMKAEIYENFYKRKGLLVLDFGDIVAEPSPTYTEAEITLLSDAKALIEYADSLGFTFLTFRDLFQPDPNYQTKLSVNHDYALVASGNPKSVAVLKNDLAPAPGLLNIAAVTRPQHGKAVITADQKNVLYIPQPNFSGIDRFNYIATNGALSETASVFVNVLIDTSVDDNNKVPTKFVLFQNYPNPFNPVTAIKYTLPSPGQVRLEIYNVNGQSVGTLVDEFQIPGTRTIDFDAKKLGNGIYFYRLQAGAFDETRKMILIK